MMRSLRQAKGTEHPMPIEILYVIIPVATLAQGLSYLLGRKAGRKQGMRAGYVHGRASVVGVNQGLPRKPRARKRTLGKSVKRS